MFRHKSVPIELAWKKYSPPELDFTGRSSVSQTNPATGQLSGSAHGITNLLLAFVENVFDSTISVQEDSERIFNLDLVLGRERKTLFGNHLEACKVRVHTNASAGVGLHISVDVVPGVTELVVDVVGELALEKAHIASFSLPDHLVFGSVLCKEPVDVDIISFHNY